MATNKKTSPINRHGARCLFDRVMRNDFVGMPVGSGARLRVAFQPYVEEFGQRMWNGEGYTIQFVQYLLAYLLAYRCPAVRLSVDHRLTPHYEAYTWGMRVRAHEDALHVVSSIAGCPFEPGDTIVNASVYAEPTFPSIAALRRRFGASLYGDVAERELWDPLLHFVNRYLVEEPVATPSRQDVDGRARDAVDGTSGDRTSRDGTSGDDASIDGSPVRRVKVERLPLPAPAAPFELRLTDDGATLLTLRDLTDEQGLARFVSNRHDSLAHASKLVVDVRECSGGSDASILPLLPFMVGEPTSLAPFMETACLTNYSKTNVARQLEQLDAMAAAHAANAELARLIDEWKADLAQKSGCGIVEEHLDVPEAMLAEVAPTGQANCVFLLTDVGTRDAADLLAEVCRATPRTTVVGRATRGSRGFFNSAVVTSECFSLEYPTSRFTDEGLARHLSGVGVPPDIHVPWTPEFCKRDLDLETIRAL